TGRVRKSCTGWPVEAKPHGMRRSYHPGCNRMAHVATVLPGLETADPPGRARGWGAKEGGPWCPWDRLLARLGPRDRGHDGGGAGPATMGVDRPGRDRVPAGTVDVEREIERGLAVHP